MRIQIYAVVVSIGLGLGLTALPSVANAALQTVTGTNFDFQYDDTKLGLFGAPTLVGDTLYFTPNNFAAASANGVGVVSTFSTISGLVLVAKNGYKFGAFDLAEFGDYNLSGAGSLVQVLGQLRAFNVAQSLTTQTTNNLVVDPATPLTLNDGLNHDWSASARIDRTTVPLPGLFGLVSKNVLVSDPGSVGLTIENRLTAYTDPAFAGLRQAFIEKKFVGVGVQVTVSPVPLPPAQILLAAGLGISLLAMRRRNLRVA